MAPAGTPGTHLRRGGDPDRSAKDAVPRIQLHTLDLRTDEPLPAGLTP